MRMATVILLCLAVISCTGCFETNSASIMGNPESQGMMGVRAGTEIVKNLEVGGSIYYGPVGDDTTTTTTTYRGHHHHRFVSKTTTTTTTEPENDYTYGAYALLHFPDLVPYVTPYAGAQATIGNGTWDIVNTIQPIGGVAIGPLFAEYQHETTNGEDNKVLFGIRLKF